MTHRGKIALLIALGAAATAAIGPAASPQNQDAWGTMSFGVEKGELANRGENPYFILEPGYVLVLAAGDERLVITVLDETRTVDGVETRIVEERETKGGRIVEISRNFYAISRRTNSIFYFGEEVDIYKDGRIVAHEGAWESGKAGARFGLMMPGQVLLKARYYQEIAPGVAMDRAEVVALDEPLKTPAGAFKACLKIAESNPVEGGGKEYKIYAPGIGLVRDGALLLVESGRQNK
jgi:hypothetical protein